MPCKDLQTKLAVHEALTSDEQSHLRSCPDCAAYEAFSDSMETQLADWRDPQSLPQRKRVPIRSSYRLAYVGLGLAAILTVAVVALPSKASAKEVYLHMMGQMREVKTVHMVVRWRPGDGRPQDGPIRKIYELWWKPGAWQEQWNGNPPTLKLAGKDGITFYRFDPKTRKIQEAQEMADQPDYQRFSFTAFATQFMQPPAKFEQPNPTTLIATNAEGWGRMVFTLDPKTGLPRHAVKESIGENGWSAAGEIDLEFDQTMPAERFTVEGLTSTPTP